MPLSMLTGALADGAYWVGTGLSVAAAVYACAALWAVLKSTLSSPVLPNAGDKDCLQPVSVLKPLHGAEPRLYENLRGFCLQTHADYQLVFGVRDREDPAIAVVQRLQAEFSNLAITLVIDPRIYGANMKVSNLINMLPHAKHPWLVLADSDISVPPNYLMNVTAPLVDSRVGIVTCLYRGIARDGFWSRVGRLFINDWFAPSVRLAHIFGSTRFAFGSTTALRQDVLVAIGGFEVLRDTLADDFWLGELTRRRQFRTVLSDLVVGTEISANRLSVMWTHELRWLRTIRAIAPVGFGLACICFTSPVLLLGFVLAPSTLNAGLALLGGSARILLYFFQRGQETSPWHDVLLIPLRDGLLLLGWAVALTSWQVKWRGNVLHARRNGSAHHY